MLTSLTALLLLVKFAGACILKMHLWSDRSMWCSIIFCEAVAIYGVIVAIILQTKIEYVDAQPDGFYPETAFTSAYAILAAGLTTGWANLACW